MRFGVRALALFSSALALLADGITLRNVQVVDVVEGRVTAPRTVHITGDRITATAAPGARVVDGTGKFAVPGLWNMHGAASFQDPAQGTTGVRDMSRKPMPVLLDLYRKFESGEAVGPRILTGGPAVVLGTANDARSWFDAHYRGNADFVRIGSGIGPEAYIALAEQSRKWRLPLVGPLPVAIRLSDAIALRQSSIEGTKGLEHAACELFFQASREGVWFTPLANEAPAGLVRFMHGCGARLLAGSQGPLQEELEAMVETAGMTPMEAIRTATYEPARFLGSDIGVIATGKLADIVLVDADPTVDIANLRRVHAVILRGKRIEIPTISTSSTGSKSDTPRPAASSAKPPASSAKPDSPIR